MVRGSQFKNADYARKFPHSGMLGSWAIVPRDQTHVSGLLHWKAGSLPPASPLAEMLIRDSLGNSGDSFSM